MIPSLYMYVYIYRYKINEISIKQQQTIEKSVYVGRQTDLPALHFRNNLEKNSFSYRNCQSHTLVKLSKHVPCSFRTPPKLRSFSTKLATYGVLLVPIFDLTSHEPKTESRRKRYACLSTIPIFDRQTMFKRSLVANSWGFLVHTDHDRFP